MRNQFESIGKEPWLAVILSGLLPGCGQIYVGDRRRGLGILLISQISLIVGLWSIFSPSGNALFGFLLMASYAIISIFNLFDAHHCARTANSKDFERLRTSNKDPWFAVFLSNIIPGLGHIYQGNWLFAVIFGGLAFGINQLNVENYFLSLLLFLILIVLFIVCPFHAYISSPVRRGISKKFVLGICSMGVLVSLIFNSSNIKEYVAESRYITSGSMLPTLKVNDRLLVDKLTYRFSKVKRGDIIIFNPMPSLQEQNYRDAFIKRVIGLPGETIEVKGGKVYINGTALKERYINEQPEYEMSQIKVPPKSYYVFGDNRNNAYDSHYWGPVSDDYIIGRAAKIFWPVNRIGSIR